MKKCLPALFCLIISLTASAQAQLETKKFKISDLPEHTMEIVLTSNAMLDAVLRSEIPDIWNLSTYEFCTEEQFQARKKSERFYFLLITDSIFNRQKEARIRSLTLFKGSPQATGEGTEGMYRIATIPFCGIGSEGDRAPAYLPALVDILQKQVGNFLEHEFNIGDMVRVTPSRMLGGWEKTVAIAKCDIQAQAEKAAGGNIIIEDEENIDGYMRNGDQDHLVGYVVYPSQTDGESVYFVMVIDPCERELYYFRKYSVRGNGKPGFTKGDIQAILAHGRGK